MRLKIFIGLIVTSLILGIISISTSSSNKLELKDIEVKTTKQEIEIQKELNLQTEKELEEVRNSDQINFKKLKELEKKNQEQLKAIEALQAKKAEKERLARAKQKSLAERALNTLTHTQTANAAESGCEALRSRLSAKGVSGAELSAAVELGRLESGCRTNNNNPSSNACNYFQEWPCGKWGGNHNTDAHLNGAIGYMQATYGSWQNALNTWHGRSPHWW